MVLYHCFQFFIMSSSSSIDEWIDILMQPKTDTLKIMPEADFRAVCRQLKEILLLEDTVPNVSAPATLVGDLHGQYYDLLELFRIGGDPSKTTYVFLGDYVDRGYNSVETWQLLSLLKVKYPNRITLLRGNHESRQVSQVYGLYDEILKKYGNPALWRDFTDVFDYLPLACVVGGKIFAVHGGLSPDISHIDQIRQIDRLSELPNEGQCADLMWSDPEEISDWATNPRGAGYVFGNNPVKQYLHLNGVSLIARAHQLVQEGFKYHFTEDLDLSSVEGSRDGLLVTVWSAPNYCYRCGNVASILEVDENLNRRFEIFKETEMSTSMSVPLRNTVPYFV
jgi:serine/threonine-protein phosphatase 6 catalytic subunit